MTLRVLIAVTHLLGAGHLTRAAALARAFLRRGHAVTLVSGGMPSPMLRLDDVEFVQLPPVRTVGTDFRNLLDASGGPVGPDHLSIRRDRLLAALKAARPPTWRTRLATSPIAPSPNSSATVPPTSCPLRSSRD